jgi:hypothetical protein
MLKHLAQIHGPFKIFVLELHGYGGNIKRWELLQENNPGGM